MSGLGLRGPMEGVHKGAIGVGRFATLLTAQCPQEGAHLVGKASSSTLVSTVRNLTQQAAVDSVETKDAQDPGHRS